MTTSNIVLVSFVLLLLFVFLGLVLPAMISSSNTLVVIGGFLIIFGMVVGTVVGLNLWFKGRN